VNLCQARVEASEHSAAETAGEQLIGPNHSVFAGIEVELASMPLLNYLNTLRAVNPHGRSLRTQGWQEVLQKWI